MRLNLKIPHEKAILLINGRIEDIGTIRRNQYGPEYYDVVRWMSGTFSVIDEIYEAGDIHPEEIRSIGLSNCSCDASVAALILVETYHSLLMDYIGEIQDSMKTPE